jgi:DNA-binding transcriptional regulator of glucitol operon
MTTLLIAVAAMMILICGTASSVQLSPYQTRNGTKTVSRNGLSINNLRR